MYDQNYKWILCSFNRTIKRLLQFEFFFNCPHKTCIFWHVRRRTSKALCTNNENSPSKLQDGRSSIPLWFDSKNNLHRYRKKNCFILLPQWLFILHAFKVLQTQSFCSRIMPPYYGKEYKMRSCLILMFNVFPLLASLRGILCLHSFHQ